ncbi:MAG TPA: biotin/lipoyl-binding protein, partial [Capsulimonadaceae bacterium]|nr:biotin/lipoyl-binding protein [Capsulimonadaceae bacterium]
MKKSASLISLIFLVLLGLILAAGCKGKQANQQKQAGPPPTPVEVTPVSTTTIENAVPVTGSIQTLYDVALAAQITGQVTFVQVREGDSVKKGQLLVQIDPTVAEQTVQQDQAAVLNDQAKVQQAQTQYEQSITNANVAILQAQQQLTAAIANLQKTKFPNQPQQLAQVKDQLIQQQANFQNAKSFYAREEQLYKEGAIAASDYDNAYTQYKTQEALLNNYQQAYNLAMKGGRSEDIKAAQQVVSEDEAAVKNAKANAGQVRVNKEAIAAAKATVKQAQATLAAAEKQLQYTKIYSPINGVVSQRN